MRTVQIGGANPDYGVLTDPDESGRRDFHWADMWHYEITRMVVAARANGLRPCDGPFGDFRDAEAFAAHAKRAAVLGCDGKWAIHPSQVGLANDIFTPPADGGRKGAGDHRRDAGERSRRRRRRRARRQADRLRLDPPVRTPGRHGRCHRGEGIGAHPSICRPSTSSGQALLAATQGEGEGIKYI